MAFPRTDPNSDSPNNPYVQLSVDLNLKIDTSGLNLLIACQLLDGGVRFNAVTKSFTVYFLPITAFGSTTEVDTNVRNLGVTGALAQLVIVLGGTPGGKASTSVSLGPFAQGGWMYAVANFGPRQTGFYTSYSPLVPVPVKTSSGVPAFEVKSPSVTRVIFTSGAFTYNRLKCYAFAPVPIDTFAGVQIFIKNYFNDGVSHALGKMYYSGYALGGDIVRGDFFLECDDGTGGPPNPGAHSCTIYFVAISATDTYRSDFATGSPNVVLATGIHS